MPDIFISYSSHDRTWAKRLAESLQGHGLTSFFDANSLRDGEGWEQQLEHGLKQCETLVCLWSARAFESEWVQREVAQFRATPGRNGNPRQPLIVRLDDRPNAFSSTQQIDLPELKQAYAGGGVDVVTSQVWQAFVDRVEIASKAASPSIEIPLVALTLTESQLGDLAPHHQRLLDGLHLNAADLSRRYGPTRMDWRPFGPEAQTLGEILATTRANINAWLDPSERMSWRFPDESFWSTNASAIEFARSFFGARLGVIIIDPVALPVLDVQTSLATFAQCVNCENVAIVAPPLRPTTPHEADFRKWIGKYASALVQDYLNPPSFGMQAPSARYAVGIGLGDADEMSRLVQRGVADFVRRKGSLSTTNHVTRV